MDQIVLLDEPLEFAFPRRLKPQPIPRSYGTDSAGVKQVAEKLGISGEIGGKRPSGAKAQRSFCDLCGTTKVVP
jgi:hypothetical protein